ncbi:hypothetical protein JHK82_047841 [Glycine max]|uniref:Uncharacterized protein n=1 Tax=Glycine soja TaxID=3848 RepID=A0A0B2QHK4_GLYSO|nr:hypothetical protein JHK86_047724 [Glycine max]KAG4933534.1 hypothetical protein JHK87_047536 [Glycine soja]KAG4943699.1 hypothetical protein JHK85_048345 [Glycine max]KAG5097987.1 hypothetical protein JHK82_047841 [Glycine max]KAG5102779.1 hypothetical protein JHK84_047748 [Glycine max]
MAVSGYMLILVKAITPCITCWVVKAQVIKLWKTVNQVNGNAIERFEMILFDSQV